MTKNIPFLILFSTILFGWSGFSNAAETIVHLAVDEDLNPATGCTYQLEDGTNVPGIDFVLLVEIQQGVNPMVTGIQRMDCAGGTFTAPATISPGGWAIGTNNGTSGGDVVEFDFDITGLGETTGLGLALQAISDDGTYDTVVDVGGGTFSFNFISAIPTLGQWLLVVYLVLMLAAGVWYLRRGSMPKSGGAMLLVLLALFLTGFRAHFISDGQIGDWNGINPLVLDANGDPTSSEASDLLAIFAADEDGRVYIRCDFADLENRPPVAVDDNVDTDEDNDLVVDVLANDSDPNAGDVITVISTTQPDHGSVTIAGDNLSVTYSPDTDYNGSDSFTYTISDVAGATDTATVNVTVNPVNDPPTDISLSNNNLDENEPSGTVVGTFTTADQDPGQDHGYVLVAGAGDTDNASFTIDGDQLKTAAILDFENQATYSIRVRTDELARVSFEESFTITLNDVNDAPTAIALDNNSVDENESAGTLVATLSSTDQDAGETFTYSLVAGAGDTGNASFQIVGDQLQTAAILDFEAQDSYSIRVQTEDGDGAVFADAFTITVNDLNDPPTDISIDNASIDENEPVNTLIGTFTSTDQDVGDTYTYTLVAGSGDTDNASFQITGDQLFSNAMFDAETQNSFSIRVRTEDASLNFEKVFTITVNDINEGPSDIMLTPSAVDENQIVGTVVGTLATTDQDQGQTHSYTLVAGAGDTDNASFTIDGDQVKTAASFDFETKSSYSIRVRTDEVNRLSYEEAITITINDVNEAPTAIALDNSTVDENQTAGTLVGNLSSTDEDAGDTFTYTLVAGAGDTDNGSFQIVSGQLQTALALDFETQNSFSVRIQSEDSGGATFSDTFTITVNDINDDPTDIALDNNTVDENEIAGTLVGNLSSTDQDVADTHTYTLVAGTGDTDNASFQIVGSQLQTAASFDFETQDSYSVRIQTDDGNGGLFAEVFTITVNDVNEGPTDIMLSPSAVDENQIVGTVVGTLTTTDEDDGQTHGYSLVAGAGDTDNASFTIDGDQLKTAAVFDQEVKSSYSIRVRTDETSRLSYEEVLTITINDINDTPTAVALDNTSVNENEVSGTLVGNLSSTDQDVGDTFTYTLVAGAGDTDNASFQIVGSQLQTAASFDFETKSSYSVRVQTEDGDGAVFADSFTITVVDQNDDPTDIALDNTSVDENEAAGTLVGNLSSTDQDVTDTHTYSLVAGAGDTDNASFQVVGTQLQTAAMFDYETKSSYNIRLQTNDGNGGLFSEAVVITINDVNDAPTISDIADQTTDEDMDISNIPFTVGDAETAAGSLIVTATSDDQTLIPNANLTLGGSGASRTLTISPAAGQSGSAVITVTVDDGTTTANDTFNLTVTPSNIGPTVNDESYHTATNVVLEVGQGATAIAAVKVTGSVLDNDTDPDSAMTVTGTSNVTAGASVVMDADGTFTYTPPFDHTGTDTFDYTVNDGFVDVVGTVTINFDNKAYFVDNTAAPGGLGRSNDPFDTLAEAQAAASAGEVIFIRSGTGTTGMDAGITLAANQILIGEGVDMVLNVNALDRTLVVAGTKPTITNTAGDGITLANGVTIRGLTVSGASQHGIAGNGVSGTITIRDTDITGSTQDGINISNASVTKYKVVGEPIDGYEGIEWLTDVDGPGYETMEILDEDGYLVKTVLGKAANGLILNNVSVSSCTLDGVSLSDVTGNFTLENGSIIENNGGNGLALDNSGGGGDLDMDLLSSTIQNNTGDEINILDNGGTGAWTSLAVAGNSGNGVVLDTVTGGITWTGSLTRTGGGYGISLNATNAAFDFSAVDPGISGGAELLTASSTANTITIGDSTVNGSDAVVVSISNSGGTYTFGNVGVTAAGAGGFNLSGNNGMTLNLNSGFSVTTTSGDGFVASEAGAGTTFNMTTAGSISATSGSALDLNGMNLNASFSSLSSTSSPDYGIRVRGSNGTINVTGTTTITSPTNESVLLDTGSHSVSFADLDIGTSGSRVTDGLFVGAAYTGTLTVTDGAIFTSGGKGFRMGSGTATVTTASVDSVNGLAIDAVGGTLNGTFSSVTANNASGGGINLQNISGTVALTSVSLTTTGGVGLNADTIGTLTIGGGSISSTNSRALNLNSLAIGAGGVGLTNVSASNTGTSSGINMASMTGSGAVNISGTATVNITGGTAEGILLSGNAPNITINAVDIDSTAGDGLEIANNTGSVTITGGDVTGASGNAVLVSGGSASVSYGGTVTNSSGSFVTVTNRTTDSVTFSGNLSTTATGLAVTNNTGGSPSITFSGGLSLGTSGSRLTGVGANFSTNTGATISLSGNTTVFTSGATGISATGGGTLSINGGTNTVDTVSGTAVIVNNVTIGGNGVTGGMVFQSIGATASTTGINLDTTGNGRFVVTGTGVATSAGNRGRVGASQGTGGVINNMSGAGITLNAANNVSLSSMNITNSTDDGIAATTVDGLILNNVLVQTTGVSGIDGISVTDFEMYNSEVNGIGDGDEENALDFGEATGSLNGMFGTCTIQDSAISDWEESGMEVRNFSGSLELVIDNCGFTGNQGGGFEEEAILFSPESTATMVVLVRDSAFLNTTAQQIDCTIGALSTDTASMNLTVNNTTFNNYSAADGMIKFDVQSNATSRLSVDSCSFTPNSTGRGIFLKQNNTATVHATITNSTVTGDNTNNFSRAIEFIHDGPGPGLSFVRLDTVTVTGYELEGFFADVRETGGGTAHITLTGMDITPTSSGSATPLYGIQVRSRNTSNVISNITGNTVASGYFFGIRVRDESGTGTHLIEGMSGTSAANAITFLSNNNTLGEAPSADGTFGDGTATLPTAATQPGHAKR